MIDERGSWGTAVDPPVQVTVPVYGTSDGQAIVNALRADVAELRSQLAAALGEIGKASERAGREWQAVDRLTDEVGDLQRELAEARAALAKDAPIAQAAREWHQARQRYLATQHSDNWRALVVAVDQSWERLLASIESDAAGQTTQEAGQ